MPDLRKISLLAVVLIVAVRLSIGWQFAYEGLWKIDSQAGPKPWTSAGYLKNARGPFRNIFRNMTGDPNDLNWLDYDHVARQWDAWHQRFLAQHPDLTDKQKSELDEILNGPPQYRTGLEQMPQGVEFGGSLAKVARFDPEIKRLIVNGSSHPDPVERHLIPAERDAMLGLVTVEKNPAPEDVEQNEIARKYQAAVRKVYELSSRLSIKEKARALLNGDPERATQIYEEHAGTVDHQRIGNIDLYKRMLNKYEKNLAAAETDFQHEHLQKQWGDIQTLRADLVGPIRQLDDELKSKARELLTPVQLARGPVPKPNEGIVLIDKLTMWSLLVIGLLLMAGLFSRLSAVAAAGLLLSFYLVMPPWPGVPGAEAGPEHSLIVNKNLIEVFALLAIAAMPTGQWFGIDAIISWLLGFGGKKRKSATAAKPAAAPATAPAPAPQKPEKQPAGG